MDNVRATLALAGPLILAQLAQVGLGFTDTVMVGRLGGLNLAAIALGGAVFFPCFLVGMGLVAAVSPVTAQARGAGKTGEIGRTGRQGLWLATLIGLPITLLLRNAEPFLLWIGQPAEVVSLAQGYLLAVSWGFLPAMWLAALRSLLEGLARPRPVMIIALIALAVNAVADYGLMFGKFGLPELGLVGTGWATAVVFWSSFLCAAGYVLWQPELRALHVFRDLRRPDPSVFKELFRVGWPISVMFGIEVFLFSATAMMMGLVSPEVLAAHQVSINAAALTFMVAVGLSLATTVRVGHALGSGDEEQARAAGLTGIGLGVGFMTMTAVLFWTIPELVVAVYLNPAEEPRVTELATSLLIVAGFFQIFDGLQATTAGALRGYKDTRRPMLLAFFGYW
ncbi:MAG: MATE family efflux transporter, partial [Bacteroidota bacterium]